MEKECLDHSGANASNSSDCYCSLCMFGALMGTLACLQLGPWHQPLQLQRKHKDGSQQGSKRAERTMLIRQSPVSIWTVPLYPAY